MSSPPPYAHALNSPTSVPPPPPWTQDAPPPYEENLPSSTEPVLGTSPLFHDSVVCRAVQISRARHELEQKRERVIRVLLLGIPRAETLQRADSYQQLLDLDDREHSHCGRSWSDRRKAMSAAKSLRRHELRQKMVNFLRSLNK